MRLHRQSIKGRPSAGLFYCAAQKVIRKLGLQNVTVELLGEGIVPDPTRVFRATRP